MPMACCNLLPTDGMYIQQVSHGQGMAAIESCCCYFNPSTMLAQIKDAKDIFKLQINKWETLMTYFSLPWPPQKLCPSVMLFVE